MSLTSQQLEEIEEILQELGTYAILCFHDRNNNGKMDFKDNGMPMEDYGVSNNVMSFAPPSYQDAKFDLGDKDLSLEIKF